MNCQVVLEMLSPYLDGVLDPAEQAAVEEHITRCPSCRVELEELRACVNLLQDLPEIVPPADFHAGLMEKIDRLPAATPAPEPKGWANRVNGVTHKGWYRTAAVAAVMVMTLGLTTMWEKEDHQFVPVEPVVEDVAQVKQPTTKDKQEPQEQAPSKSNSADPEVSVGKVKTTPSSQKPKQQPATTKVDKAPAIIASANVDRKFVTENYKPQPSEGMVARSVTLKLDVEDIDGALKAIGTATQNAGGTIVVPYQESNGKVLVKLPAQNARQAEGQYEALGQVITDMPTERDLSGQHKQAVDALEQLKAQQAALQDKYNQEKDAELEKQLATLNAAIQQQVSLIQQIEQQSNYTFITITLQ